MKFIVKLSPEITIKTRPVRRRFSVQLQTNIRRVFKRHALSADIVLRWDMLEVVIAAGEASAQYRKHCQLAQALLEKIPGIAHFIQVQERPLAAVLEDRDAVLEEVYQQTQAVVGELLRGKTFVVRCKRQGQHNFTSHDIERYVGGGLNQHSGALGVKMRGADIVVNLEIKQARLFIVERRHVGLGGYPIGCVGPVLSLMSGGYDSSVASFNTMRRGMETHFCFFNLGGHAHEVGVKQVSHFLWDEYGSSHRTAFVNVNFERVVEEILSKVDRSYMGVILKRMMIRAASQIAEQMRIEVLVTGENVAQVSSQTVRNLSVIDRVTQMLVLRPLVTDDKSDIISKATEIDVARYAENMPEYCAVISDKPTTAAKMPVVEAEEARFDFSILDAAIENKKISGIDSVYQQEIDFADIELQAIPDPEQIVIDLRDEDEQEKSPLILHSNELLSIPFYKINRLFHSLDASKQYLLYCDRGVMSKLHAVHLRGEGFDNVKVYRPAQQVSR